MLTRDEGIPALRNVVVALVTRTIREIPTEVPLREADGMPSDCVISLDNLSTVPRALLTEEILTLDATKMSEVCRALAAATDC